MKFEQFFQDLAWTENIFIQDERRQEIFNMLKPVVDKEDLDLATAMGDPTLMIPIWISQLRQTLKKKRKEQLKKTLHRIISSQKALTPVPTQPELRFSDQNKRVTKRDAQPDDVILSNKSTRLSIPDLEPITTVIDPDVIMEVMPKIL